MKRGRRPDLKRRQEIHEELRKAIDGLPDWWSETDLSNATKIRRATIDPHLLNFVRDQEITRDPRTRKYARVDRLNATIRRLQEAIELKEVEGAETVLKVIGRLMEHTPFVYHASNMASWTENSELHHIIRTNYRSDKPHSLPHANPGSRIRFASASPTRRKR